MYDDHDYCPVCGKHARGCWCLNVDVRPPDLAAEDLTEAREAGLCEGHGYLVVVAALYKRGMTWARGAGLARGEFQVVLRADQLTGIHSPTEVVVHSYPDMATSTEVRVLRSAGVKVWHVP